MLITELVQTALLLGILAAALAGRRPKSAAGAERAAPESAEERPSAETLRAAMAEKRFSEGVINVLNYENPAEREREQ